MKAAAERDRPELRGVDRPELRGVDRGPLLVWEQLLATAAGSALAAFLLSRLGVAGTIVGAAVTPVIITVTSATLSPHLRYARERAASAVANPRASSWRQLVERLPRGRRLATALLTAGAAFAIVAVAITIAEALAGKPVNDWGRHGGTGYTFTGGGPSTTTGESTAPAFTKTHTTSQPSPASSHSSQTTSRLPRSQPRRTTHTAPPVTSTASTPPPTTTTTRSGSASNPTGGAPLP